MEVCIVPIGIGWSVSEEELDIMANNGHYVLVDNFHQLAKAMYDVMDLVCNPPGEYPTFSQGLLSEEREDPGNEVGEYQTAKRFPFTEYKQVLRGSIESRYSPTFLLLRKWD